MEALGISLVITIATPTAIYEYAAPLRSESEALRVDPTPRFEPTLESVWPGRLPATAHARLALRIPDGRRFPILDGGVKQAHGNGLLQFAALNVFLTETPASRSGPPCGFQIPGVPRDYMHGVRELCEAVSTLAHGPRIKRSAESTLEQVPKARRALDEEEARARGLLATL